MRGYYFERQVMEYLNQQGFLTFRVGGSKFPDVIAISKSKTMLVSCKTRREYFRKGDLDRLRQSAMVSGAVPAIAYRKNGQVVVEEI